MRSLKCSMVDYCSLIAFTLLSSFPCSVRPFVRFFLISPVHQYSIGCLSLIMTQYGAWLRHRAVVNGASKLSPPCGLPSLARAPQRNPRRRAGRGFFALGRLVAGQAGRWGCPPKNRTHRPGARFSLSWVWLPMPLSPDGNKVGFACAKLI